MKLPHKFISLISLAAFALSLEGADLSVYRDFHLGMSMADVVKATAQSRVRVISTRPERVEELDWQVGWLPPSSRPARVPFTSLAFGFYNGALYQITVSYDRDQTLGLTDKDMVDSISGVYGIPDTNLKPRYQDAIAIWDSAQTVVSLVRLPYYAGFGLILSSKATLALAEQARLESVRLDLIDAPLVQAALQAQRLAEAQLANEKARSVNKAEFHP